MKATLRALGLTSALALCAAAQPVILTNGIVNGASFVRAGLPNGNIAQGSIFSIFGSGMGPGTAVNATTFPLPTTTGLGGTTVEVTSGSTTVNAVLLMASAGQVNAILPSSVPPGTANVVVKYNGGTSASQQITIVKSSFGAFAANQAGTGPAALMNYFSDANQPQNSVVQAAHRGQVVILWGTGLGPVNFDETNAPGANATNMASTLGVSVSVGGKAVTPQYAGRSPQFAGLDQVNFQLPNDVAEACYVPVTVKIGGIVSNTTTLSIGSGSAPGARCEDEFTLLPDDLSNGLRTGAVILSRISTAAGETSLNIDSASASFNQYAATDVGKMHATYGVSTYGTCGVYNYKGTPSYGEIVQSTPLNAGAALTLTLPDNSTKTLSQSISNAGSYAIAGTGSLTPWLVPGLYKIAVPGATGANAVGAFNANLTLPSPLTWANMSQISTIPRNTGLRVTWSGGTATDAILIMGMSTLADETGAGFYCLAKQSDLEFTVPADVLSSLPPSSGTGDSSTGYLAVGDFPLNTAGKVSPTPQGLDVATFIYQFLSAKVVTYQ